ncbi:MAG: monovalent cation/H+ antiporter subunit D family protein [Rhodospirillaceae bacterium]|nr:monovalent cation/H+ antiporter subunit D family protein [Rhodospirillaceae bacterium]MBT5676137.1 monovalent cation/H+ antiporter subunit D family protein [Rhodospirillaceae bacterium]MBT5780726.1 monovalent cation/H+ antiporter subunit D family protein [Rhodospirillaceae bacterium]
MSAGHLPILQVAIPLIAAPLCVLLRRPGLAWAFTTLVSWALFAISILLLIRVLADGTISYHLGGWAPPFGIEYRLDAVNSFVLLVITGIAAVVTPYARQSVAQEIAAPRHNLFYALYLLALTGLLGITATGDAFNIYVFMEISSLASYVLIALGPSRRARAAAFQYLIMGTIGATFLLIGIGLLYMMTGTLNLADLSVRIHEVPDMRPIYAAFAFVTIGVLIKLALFPLHIWLPNAYTYAPTAVSAFLAASATKVGAYVLLRFVFTLFGQEFSFERMPLMEILMPLSLVAILVGSGVAIFQTNLKRLFAYSSIAQIGYLALGISFASTSGLTGAIVHIFNHAMMKGGIFLALGCIMLRTGSVELSALNGLGRRMPFTMAALVIGGLGLVGVPVTSGFVSKWYLVQAALEADLWPVALLILLGSLLALIYVGRVIEAAYFRTPAPEAPAYREAPWQMLLPTWILIAASLYFGVHTEITVGVAERAAATLLGGAS